MKRKQFSCFCIIALECSFLSLASAEPANLQVIESQEVDLGNRSVTFNLVEPPEVIEPETAPATQPLTAAEQQEMERLAVKKQATLQFSATVYDHKFTELRWTYEGKEYRAFSNIDFNYLRAVDQFETADTVFTMALGIGDESTQGMTALERAKLPLLSQFDATKEEFKLPSEGPTVTAEVVAGLTALHAYYSANKQQIIDQYNAEQVKQAEYTQWLKEHPPVVKDTVVNFWPEKNNYLQKVGVVEGAAQ